MLLKKNYTDPELLESLKEENQLNNAVRFIYNHYYAMSATYITQNNGSLQDAEDIFQEILVSFIELVKGDKFRGECSISTFLYTLTRYRWLNQLKKNEKTKTREAKFEKMQEKIEFDFGGWLEMQEARQTVVQLLQNLGDSCRKILLAFYYDNLSIREILQLLPYENEQVVRNKKYKCLKQMEEIIRTHPELIRTLKKN